MNVVLISTYELGRQSFGVASTAAWLAREGACVTCFDLAIQSLARGPFAAAGLVAVHLPMHTATRIAAALAPKIKQFNPRAHLCFYGLYAPMNESYLRGLGADTILGGEFEAGLAALYRRLAHGDATGAQQEPLISLARQEFLTPERGGLPPLGDYARLVWPGGRESVTGYTEASRGCKHLCRHCPIVPVYQGRFRVVARDVVLADIAQQVSAGAEHITFGDPDFFNSPAHALGVARALHQRFPALTYDATIKVEHLLKHAAQLPELRETGCVLVTSAVEAVDDHILDIFDKGHTRADFIRAAALMRTHGLALNPTFVSFNPWISLEGYEGLLALLEELDLAEHVAPIQLAIRLLIPRGSRLLELPEARALAGAFDEAALCYPWAHPDPRVDALYAEVLAAVKAGEANGQTRREIFQAVRALARAHAGARSAREDLAPAPDPGSAARAAPAASEGTVTAFSHVSKPIPHLSEPWYC